MRRQRTRLLLRDLAAVCALVAMAISGALPIWAMAVFGVGAVVALFGQRPFAPNGFASVALLIASAAGLALIAFDGGLDPVLAACVFAGLLAINRMLCQPSRAVDHQVLLASLLMIGGAAALTADLLFALCLAAFVVLAFGALALGVVEEASEDEPLPKGPILRRVVAGGLAAVLVGTGLFFLFPRVSWHRFAPRAGASFGPPATGFSDRISLTGDGRIKRDLRVVARIWLRPDPGVDSLGAYWVGSVLDHFNGQGWEAAPSQSWSDERESLTLAPGGAGVVSEKVELLPAFGSRTLIALDAPIYYGNALGLDRSGVRAWTFLQSAAPPGRPKEATQVRFVRRASSYQYFAYSLPGSRPAPSDRARRADLALPEDLDPRIPALAKQVAGGRPPAQAARALERYLRSGYRYTLELSGASGDPVADFLFTRKAGHCEQFATGLTLLLRSLGIPARVVTGFFGGERTDDVYVLRGGDAHAWSEAFVDGHWERLDATPPESREAQGSWLAEAISRAWAHLDSLWRGHVVDFTLNDQMQAVSKIASPRFHLPRVDLRFGFFLALLLGGVLLLARSLRLPHGRRAEATRLLDRAERLIARHAISAEPGEGIEELTVRLAAARHPAARSLQRLTRRYLEARFGTRPLLPEEPERLLHTLSQALERKTTGAS